MLLECPNVEIICQTRHFEQTMELMDKHGIDVIIGDIPLSNGIKQIKNRQRPSTIIIFTNESFPQYRKKCLSAGADFFFDSSTEFDQFTTLITRMSSS